MRNMRALKLYNSIFLLIIIFFFLTKKTLKWLFKITTLYYAQNIILLVQKIQEFVFELLLQREKNVEPVYVSTQ